MRAHHCGVHFFVTSPHTILPIHTVFDTHLFCGSIARKWGNKSIRNLTQKTPRGAPGTRAAEYNHLRTYTYVYTIYIRQFLPYYYRRHAQTDRLAKKRESGGGW